MRSTQSVHVLLLSLFVAFICLPSQAVLAQDKTARQSGPFRAVVTISPLEGLIKPLLPKGAELRVLMPPGRSEHGYEFTAKDLAAVSRADVLVYIGLGLEPRIEAELKKRPKTTGRAICFADAVGIAAEEHDHDHKEGEDHHHHHHHGPDPHLWLDPILVTEFLPKVAEAIQEAQKARGELNEAETARIAKAMSDTVRRVQEMDQTYRSRLTNLKGRAIVTHHNAFPRLAERYGLVVAESIMHFETGEPSPAEIANVMEAIKKHGVKTIFFEPQYDKRIATKIAKQAKVRLGKLDPLGDGDWFKMMRANLDELVKGLE